MYMKGSPTVRYEIIADTIKNDNNLLNISYLCKLAGISVPDSITGRAAAKTACQ